MSLQTQLDEFRGPLRAALHALSEGRAREAAGLLEEHLREAPADAVAFAALGVAMVQIGDGSRALEALERAHYLKPHDPGILYSYGLVLEALGRWREAHLRFTSALRLDPDHEPAWRRRAALEAESGAWTLGVEPGNGAAGGGRRAGVSLKAKGGGRKAEVAEPADPRAEPRRPNAERSTSGTETSAFRLPPFAL